MIPSFTVDQSSIAPANVTVTDTSTSVTGSITQRRIYLQDAYGNYLTGDGVVNYTAWPLADASITISVLTQDTAGNIKVEWLDVSNNVVETLNNNYPMSKFGKQFFVYLVQAQGLTPGIIQDANYNSNIAVFWSNIIAGDNQVTDGNDIAGAQNCYNREIYMQQNQSDFFGTQISV